MKGHQNILVQPHPIATIAIMGGTYGYVHRKYIKLKA